MTKLTPPRRPLRLLALVMLPGLAGGCDEQRQRQAPDELPLPRLVSTLEPRPVLPFAPGRSIAYLGAEKVLLVDQSDPAVVVHDVATGATRRYGREGHGPGELQTPVAALPTRSGDLVVVDIQMAKVERWSHDGEMLDGMHAPQVPLAVWPAGDELLLLGAPFTPGAGPTLFRIGWDGAVRKSWDLFRVAPRLTETADGRQPSIFLSAGRCSDGSVVAGNGAEYLLARVDSTGRLVGSFARPELPPLRLSEVEIREREARLARAVAGMPAMARGAMSKLDRRLIEAPRPHFGGPISTDASDRLWVITNHSPADSTRIDLFDCGTGSYVRTVVLRDAVMAVAHDRDRLFALVRRTEPQYLDQQGIDVYEFAARP